MRPTDQTVNSVAKPVENEELPVVWCHSDVVKGLCMICEDECQCPLLHPEAGSMSLAVVACHASNSFAATGY